MTKLNGYKTYILAVAALVYAAYGYYTGTLDSHAALDAVWAALTAAAVRHGVAQ